MNPLLVDQLKTGKKKSPVTAADASQTGEVQAALRGLDSQLPVTWL